MFGVGLHFSVTTLLLVRRIALPGAIAQIVAATAVGALLAEWWGWSLAPGLVFGLLLSVASTVVLLRALQQRNELVTRAWLRLRELPGQELSLLEYPLPEVRERMKRYSS